MATIATIPRTITTTSSEPVDGARIERDAEEEDADGDRDDRAHRADARRARPRDPAG